MSRLLRIVTVGRTRRGPLLTLEEDYLVRIARLAAVRREIAPVSPERRPADRRRHEGRALADLLGGKGVNIAVDEAGQLVDSEQFRDLLARWRTRGDVTFVVGGPDGLDEELVAECDERLALGPLTLSHELALIVLVEQIYRALAAEENHPFARH